MSLPTKKELFDLACRIYETTRVCKHSREFYRTVRPYKCNLTQKECGVCGMVIEKVYDD